MEFESTGFNSWLMSRKVTYLGYTLASYVNDEPKLEFNQFLEISEIS